MTNSEGTAKNHILTALICLLAVLFTWAQSGAGEALIVREAVRYVTLKGYTRAANSRTLTAEVSGRVLRVNYEVGQAVMNAPFIEIDTTFVDLAIDGVERQLERLRAAQERAASQVNYLKKEFGRQSTLFKQGHTSEAKYDAAEQSYTQATLELASVEAERATVEISLEELREKRARHSVLPPKGWTITARMIEPGEVVVAGQPLGRASDFSALVVPLTVSLGELEALKSGGDAMPGTLEGREVETMLNWYNPEFDERTRKSAVEIGIINTGGSEMRGGLSLDLPLKVKAEGLLVPKAAVSWRYDNPVVTPKGSDRHVSLLVVDESGEYLVVADDGSLGLGQELLPAK